MSASPASRPLTDPSLLAPEHIRSLGRYVPGKPVGELAREFGFTASNIVKLASNENPRGPSPAVRAAIAARTLGLGPRGFSFDASLTIARGSRPNSRASSSTGFPGT